MANPIVTTGTNPGPISTDKQLGETRGEWIARHHNSVMAATPTGDMLTTNWYSSTCGAMERTSNRKQNETDEQFRKRHVDEYEADMVNCPPVY